MYVYIRSVSYTHLKYKNNDMMIMILSHIVESRNGESGLHVLHIKKLTKLLLNILVKKTNQYSLTLDDMISIEVASSLHDIGKIAIPEEILNKPSSLTKEEMEVMKSHVIIGAKMLNSLPFYNDEPIVKYGYQICRWHHERYDGNGYPDGLKGEEIPIAAQVVSIVDAYDALTSKRVYKEAYSHEEALKMIQKGKCGVFNPLLIECLMDIESYIQNDLKINEDVYKRQQKGRITLVPQEMVDLPEEYIVQLQDKTIFSPIFATIYEYAFTNYVGDLNADIHVPDGIKKVELNDIFGKEFNGDFYISEIVDDISFGYGWTGHDLYGKYIVDENNPNFSSNEDGLLMDKSQTVILQTPIADAIYIPEGVTSISSSISWYVHEMCIRDSNLKLQF